jgi:trans-2,3-dihydro-3-hydroxyanthranilate isomerase
MRQRDPEFGATFSREEVARLIGLPADDIVEEWPIQSVSTGLTFTIVPVRNPAALAKLNFASAPAEEFLKERGGKFFYFLCPERSQNSVTAQARMFFYGIEDPATGSAAGCAAGWMVQQKIAASDEQAIIRQGAAIRRPSEMYVRAAREGDRVTNVRVGGYAVEVLRGTVRLV